MTSCLCPQTEETVLEQILRTSQVQSETGECLDLNSHVAPGSGRLMQDLVRSINARTTLEVGLAYGVSALFICEALADIGGERHIAIDPLQRSERWRNIGVLNVQRAGYGHLLDIREQYSHHALSDLEREGVSLDFAFIDGWHTFDYTLVDLFLVDRILRVGGIVMVDDTEWSGVRKACRYFLTNRKYSVVACWGEQPSKYGLARKLVQSASRRSSLVRSALKPEWTLSDRLLGLTPGCRCIAMMKEADDDLRGCFGHEAFLMSMASAASMAV